MDAGALGSGCGQRYRRAGERSLRHGRILPCLRELLRCGLPRHWLPVLPARLLNCPFSRLNIICPTARSVREPAGVPLRGLNKRIFRTC